MTHHRCAHPWRHALLTLLVCSAWLYLMLAVYPTVAQHLTRQSLYVFGPMLLGLVPGVSLVLALSRWQCQPVPRGTGRLQAFGLGFVLGRLR